jgi:hypothetical protein
MQCSARVSGIDRVGSDLNEDLCKPEDVGVEVEAEDSRLPRPHHAARADVSYANAQRTSAISRSKGLSHLRQVLAGLDVLPKCLGARRRREASASENISRSSTLVVITGKSGIKYRHCSPTRAAQ